MGGIGIYGPRPGDTTTPTPVTFTGGFDFVIRNRADLAVVAPPAAGVFTLPTGSYAVRGDVLLNAGERIAVPNTVMWFGSPGVGVIGTSAAPNALVTVTGLFTSFGLFYYNAGATQPGLRINAGSCFLQTSGVFADGAGSDACEMVGSGVVLRANQTDFFGLRSGLHMIGGRAYATGCNVFSGSDGPNGAAIRQTGALLLKRFFGTGCEIVQTGTNPAIHMDSLLGNVNIVNSLLAFTQNDVPAAVLAQCKSLCLGAGTVLTHQGGGNRVGVSIQGETHALDLDHCQFEGWTFAAAHVAGVVDRTKVCGVDMNGGTALLDWLPANIPTDGLLVTGNSVNAGALFNGFTVTDARVNAKANSINGALFSETPIVP